MMKLHRGPVIFAIFLLTVGVFWWHRQARPVLDDAQIIDAQIDEMRAAAERKDPGGITRYLAEDFRWTTHSKRNLHSQLGGYFFTLNAVQVELGDVQTRLNGQSAVTEGGYRISTRADASAPFETQGGRFTLQWRKIKGEWRIEKAEGGESSLQ